MLVIKLLIVGVIQWEELTLYKRTPSRVGGHSVLNSAVFCSQFDIKAKLWNYTFHTDVCQSADTFFLSVTIPAIELVYLLQFDISGLITFGKSLKSILLNYFNSFQVSRRLRC